MILAEGRGRSFEGLRLYTNLLLILAKGRGRSFEGLRLYTNLLLILAEGRGSGLVHESVIPGDTSSADVTTPSRTSEASP
ncbi:hypothetical protein NVV30_13265, partial [Pseudomonas syringae]|nr:hypothetical protein [Pseudomonas syringae]